MKGLSGDFAIAIHPGAILKEMLEENDMSQAYLARHLKMDPSKINEICQEKRGLSAEMATMLAKAFGISAGTWLNMQKNWELSQVDKSMLEDVAPLKLRA